MRALFLVAAIAGCAPERPGPAIRLDIDPAIAPAQSELIADGAYSWRAVGFLAEPWDDFEPDDAQVWVKVRAASPGQLNGNPGGAIRDLGLILLDLDVIGSDPWALRSAAAHELGHILLDTGEHLAPGVAGVMALSGGTTVLSDADYALACAVAELCDRF